MIDTYDVALTEAVNLLDGRCPLLWMEGEREKAMNDALNNAWYEGITVQEWVDAAARQLGYP